MKGAQQLLGFNDMNEFCFTASGLSQNLGMLIETFYRPKLKDWQAGKTKMLMLDTEFFSDRAIASSVMRRSILTADGFNAFEGKSKPKPEDEIFKILPNKDGLYSTDDVIKAIRTNADKLQIICLPDIVFSTGQRLELDKIFSVTRDVIEKHQIKVIIDLAYIVGNRSIKLATMPITAAVGCAYKHLCGPAGSAFGIYVNGAVDLSQYPPIQGWKSADPSKVLANIDNYNEEIMEQKGGAVAFRTSNPPPLSLLPAQTFLSVFGAIGFDKLFDKSERLTQYLIAQLQRHVGDKIEIVTPLDPKRRGATICIRVKDGTHVKTIEEQLKMAG